MKKIIIILMSCIFSCLMVGEICAYVMPLESEGMPRFEGIETVKFVRLPYSM